MTMQSTSCMFSGSLLVEMDIQKLRGYLVYWVCQTIQQWRPDHSEIIEGRLSEKIQQVSNEILLDHLTEEVRLSMELSTVNDANDFALWKQSIINKEVRLLPARLPRVTVSFDMGWQQRASGHKYNSASGHALLVGALTRKPIAFILKLKRCNFCVVWKKKNKDITEEAFIPFHNCSKNHKGSSKAMEPQACLEMVVDLYDNFSVVVERIVLDDDSSTRTKLKWSNEDWKKNNNMTEEPMVPKTKGKNKGDLQRRKDYGRLPGHIPEPTWLADPNHRRNVLTGELIGLTKETVGKRATMTKMDMTRIGKNFSYMIRQLPRTLDSEYDSAGRAVLDHYFDDHTYCGQWCPSKRGLPLKGYYRSRQGDAELYD
jgi:hypothetical protein